MTGRLDVLVLHAADAERADAGGADRLLLVGAPESGGRSPEPALVGQVRRVTVAGQTPVSVSGEQSASRAGDASSYLAGQVA